MATVGALNAIDAGSAITPAGNKSVVTFGFKAVVPDDGSAINIFEGSNGRDDRTSVIAKLGEPETDRWQSELGTQQYEALGYPARKITVILMGIDRKSALYIGTLDRDWHPIHSIALRSGGTTASLLRGLRRF